MGMSLANKISRSGSLHVSNPYEQMRKRSKELGVNLILEHLTAWRECAQAVH
jgi:hypothetical protein